MPLEQSHLRVLPRLAAADRPADRSSVPERRGWTCAAARSGSARPAPTRSTPGSRISPRRPPLCGCQGRGEGQAVSDYLQDSPSAARWEGAAGGGDPRPHEGHGQAGHTAGRQGEVQASGDASFHDNRVRIAALDLPLEKVAGRLEYDNEHTRIHNLKASLWNQPLTLDYGAGCCPVAIRPTSSSGQLGQPPPAPGHPGPWSCSRGTATGRAAWG